MDLIFVSEAKKVIDVYNNGGDWKTELVGEASKFIVVVGIGGAAFGLLIGTLSIGWLLLAGVAIGIIMELTGEFVYSKVKDIYKNGFSKEDLNVFASLIC